MFYKQFSKLTNCIDEDLLNDFDFWLATLPENKCSHITISAVSCKFEIQYAVAEMLLSYAYNNQLLEKQWIICCPKCGLICETVSHQDLEKVYESEQYCHSCDTDFIVRSDIVYLAYKRKCKPNVSDREMKKAISQRIGYDGRGVPAINFSNADSLANRKEFYELFYKPDESAYQRLQKMKERLDDNFGRSTTAKGTVYEELIVELFSYLKYCSGTRLLHSYTNQFDCTIFSPMSTSYPSIYNKLTPYFILECKNEDKTPSNTYFHKLSDIMSSNEAQVGIVCSRLKPSKEDITIAHNKYLENKNTKQNKYMISISNDDLDALIDKRENLLEYLDYKINELTLHARNATYDLFTNQGILKPSNAPV